MVMKLNLNKRKILKLTHRYIDGSQYTDIVWAGGTSSRYHHHLSEQQVLATATRIDKAVRATHDSEKG